MKKILFVLATIVALAFAFSMATVSAEEKKEGAESNAVSAAEQMDNYVKQGPGIHNIKKDDKGRVQSLILVGQSRISTVLGATKGKEVARKRAEQSAKATFIKWLGEAVVVCENSENETTMFLQGEEGKDKEALSEAGKAVEKNSDTYKSVASGLIRGLTLLHSDLNAEDKEYSVIYGWSLANAKSAKHTATHDPGIDEKPPVTESAAPSSNDISNQKKLHSQKQTSPEAEGFLK
jgi:ABC-type cobalt transport system substrate-binding protein